MGVQLTPTAFHSAKMAHDDFQSCAIFHSTQAGVNSDHQGDGGGDAHRLDDADEEVEDLGAHDRDNHSNNHRHTSKGCTTTQQPMPLSIAAPPAVKFFSFSFFSVKNKKG